MPQRDGVATAYCLLISSQLSAVRMRGMRLIPPLTALLVAVLGVHPRSPFLLPGWAADDVSRLRRPS